MKDWKTRYDEDLQYVFTEAIRIIHSYPEPLKERGQRYLEAFNPLLKESTKNYICYLLPCWLRPMTGVDAETARRLSLANVFGMLYFFVQDDVMDASIPMEWKGQLALGNLYHSTFLRLYREQFDSSSSFWDYYETYVAEWSVSVATEGLLYDVEANPSRLAKKSAPVKLASTGSFLLSGRTELIDTGSNYVENVLITLQMVDDWMDWEDDLAEGNDNSLLSFICSALSLESRGSLTLEMVNECFYSKEIFHAFAHTARVRHELLAPLRHDSPDLYDFHESLTMDLENAAISFQSKRKSLILGGLSHWLSENIKF